MKALIFISTVLLNSINLFGQRSYFTINFDAPQIGQELHLNINFDAVNGSLSPASREVLDSLIKKLFYIDTFSFLVEYHTDCRATKEANAELSQRRADSIAGYIRRNAQRKPELKARGMGEIQLLNDCSCEGKIKAHYTRYFEDTVNCIITRPVIEVYDSNTMQFKTVSYEEVETKIKNSEAFIPCREHHQHVNRRVIIRISGRKRRF